MANKRELMDELTKLGVPIPPNDAEGNPPTNKVLQELIDKENEKQNSAGTPPETGSENGSVTTQTPSPEETNKNQASEPVEPVKPVEPQDSPTNGSTVVQTPVEEKKEDKNSIAQINQIAQDSMKGTQAKLDSEADVQVEIPLDLGEEVGTAFLPVIINGVLTNLPKGELISVKRSVYLQIRHRRTQLANAGARQLKLVKKF